MREIKFRAWNGIRMEYDVVIHSSKNSNCLIRINNEDFVYEYECMPIMQYTGLKDKNGKEIYEGDVLNTHRFLFDGTEYETELKCIIQTGEYGWMAKNIMCDSVSEYMGYNKEDMKKGIVECYFMDLYGLHEESFEIIGNIHENPDLLK